MIVIAGFVLLSRSGWDWEWARALSWASTSTVLLCPAVAGIVAFDVSRRLTKTIAAVTASTTRGHWILPSLVAAICTFAIAAWALGVVYAVFRAQSHDGMTISFQWVLIEAPIAIIAAGFFGAAVGVLVRGVAAAPLAAILAYVLPIFLDGFFGLRGVLSAGGATGSMIGAEPNPSIVAMVIFVNVLIGILGYTIAVVRPRPLARPNLLPVAAAMLLLGVILAGMNSASVLYRQHNAEQICLNDGITEICGPTDAGALLPLAARDLGAAHLVLTDRGMKLTSKYLYEGGQAPLEPGVGILYMSAELIENGHMDTWDLVLTMATPTGCAGYYADVPPEGLLDSQRHLAEWFQLQLEEGAADSHDLETAQATYDALLRCDAAALPQWTVAG